jgi:ADP-heptose:LPS heptosyltransferase
MKSWRECNHILCVRLDNLGDVIMSSAAFASIKKSFRSKLTLLTSSAGAAIGKLIPAIDDVIIYDAAWVKNDSADNDVCRMADELKRKRFDGAMIFTVFSQNPMPAIMLTWMAQIPLRASYCRENPYGLLTDWLPDKEPYTLMQHQVQRDLALVRFVGGEIIEEELSIAIPGKSATDFSLQQLERFIILHPGVSEEKRKVPDNLWIQIGREISIRTDMTIAVTGSASERTMAQRIADGIGDKAICLAGEMTVADFVCLIHRSKVVVSVNTGTIHIAAAVKSKVIVLYALTNPQHAPWRTVGKVFPFSVEEKQQSKNEVLVYTQAHFFRTDINLPVPQEVADVAAKIIDGSFNEMIPLLVTTDGIRETMAL